MPPQDRYVAETSIRVRYAETDGMRIVHHSNYIKYFEEGRSAYARQRGKPYSTLEAEGMYLTVTEVNARYLKPAVYEQIVTVQAWIHEMKSRGLTFMYEIVESASNNLLVTGYTKHICITHDGKIARIPDSWRNWAGSL